MSSPTKFGRNLRRLRVRAGLTQMALAAASGVSQTHLSALELGTRREISFTRGLALARALRVAPGDLVR